eukprot:scaffold278_cov195-Amphora_coffeaeformis.AAC.15
MVQKYGIPTKHSVDISSLVIRCLLSSTPITLPHFVLVAMMMLAQVVRKELYAESSNKESETVRTAESSDDDYSDCCCSVGSLEEIDLLDMGDEADDCYPSFYYDDDMDLLEGSRHKDTCVQRALSGFTGMLQALLNISSDDRPMDVVMTDTFLMTEYFAR